MATKVLPTAERSSLRPNCLNFSEIFAQAVALISPTMTAALIVPVMFANAGNGSWLAYAFGTVMLLFVALNLNQFAKRSTSAGSMYAYTSRGLGPTAGGIAGWCLIWAYLFISIAGLTGFANFANVILDMAHIHQAPPILLFAISAGVAWYIAYKDIEVSTILMLVLEAISVALILVLTAVVLFHHGLPVDHDQLTLKGTSFSNMGFGVVVAIFSLVGFECATAFGEEAKNPLKTIPRAVIWSLLATGIFFVVVTYMEVYGTRGYSATLDTLSAPLNILADINHVPWLKLPISLGAMVSFFSLSLSCMNAGARILYPMGRHGVFHSSVGQTHEKHETPHIAVTVMTALMFLVATGMILWHPVDVDVFGFAGTFGAFGFLAAYFLITIATPAYLKKIGELTSGHIALAAVTLILLMVPAVGSVYTNPPLTPPVKYFPYIFLVYFALGVAWFMSLKMRSPEVMADIERDIEETHGRFDHIAEPVAAG